MNMTGVSVLGWLHTLACTVAIVVGAYMLAGPKGTALHRRTGRWYIYIMLVANISSFGVYHFDISRFVPLAAGAGRFGLFHWESVFTLAFLLLAWFAASRQRRAAWAYVHPVSMLVTYYMLIGGLVNELFVRVEFLRNFARAQLHGTGSPGRFPPVVGDVQGVVMLVFMGLMIYFVTRVALYRRGARAVAA
jgi:uncharacterized membrane protein